MTDQITITVTREWYDKAVEAVGALGALESVYCTCSSDRTISDHGDETFLPRTGCLECDKWRGPVMVRVVKFRRCDVQTPKALSQYERARTATEKHREDAICDGDL